MKKFFVIFALFCAVFMISCGSGSDNETAEQPEGTSDSDTVTDNESESQDSSSQDAGKTDTEETPSDDDSDAAEPQRNEGELYGECYPNNTCNEGLVCDTENNICIKDKSSGKDDSDSGDSTDDKDSGEDKNDAEPQPDEDSGTNDDDPGNENDDDGNGSDDDTDTATDTEEAEKCAEAGGNWNAAEKECTKTADCPDKPANSVWNGAYSYTRTYTDGEWSAEIPTEYSTISGTCKYKCKETHYYHDNQCLNPCDTNPCAEIANAKADTCLASSWQNYSCECNEGYFWNQMKCKKPLNIGNICTGQNKCYNNNKEETITCPSSTSADFYGQDAQFTSKCTPQSFTLESNVFVDNETGLSSESNVVVDNNTGLIWEKSLSSGTYGFEKRTIHCNALNKSNYAGKSNWRVPNPIELLTIVDHSKSNPATNLNFTGMPTENSTYLWTNKERKVNSNTYGYYFSPSYGTYDAHGEKGKAYKVICVSGNELLPAASSDFTTSSDGKTVTDTRTGLIWQKEYATDKTWQQALAYCQSLNTERYGGYSKGWRLPNRNELASLLDLTKSNASNFPDMPNSTFWSSTTSAGATSGAWQVYFYWGDSHSYNKTNNSLHVRCVRNAE